MDYKELDYKEIMKRVLKKNVSKNTLQIIARELFRFSGEEKARLAISILHQSHESDEEVVDEVFQDLFDDRGIEEFNYNEIIELLPKIIMFGRQERFIEFIKSAWYFDSEVKGDIIMQFNEQEEAQADYDGREPILVEDTWF